MASTLSDLNAAITSLTAAVSAAVTDSTAAFGRLKNIDYATQVTALNTQTTSLQGLSTLAKSQ